jgi:hypothetical protein
MAPNKGLLFMAMTAPEIEKFITDALPDAVIEIKDLAGDGNHYSATVPPSKGNPVCSSTKWSMLPSKETWAACYTRSL